MFNTEKDESGHRYKLLDKSVADPNCMAMLVDGSYSGSGDMLYHGYRYTLTGDDYQAGDIFCMRYADTVSDGTESNRCYHIAICQGEDAF